jgi:type II secretory pathway pseudopilin PulG
MKSNPSPRSAAAMTLLELLVVIAVIVVLMGMLPSSVSHKAKPARIKCVNNLKQIGLAFKVFAGDNDDHFPWNTTNGYAQQFTERNIEVWRYFEAMSNELSTAKVLLCTGDRARVAFQADTFDLGPKGRANQQSLAYVSSARTNRDFSISYFVGIRAAASMPEAILAGDRNLADNDTAAPFGSRGTAGSPGQTNGSSSLTAFVPARSKWTAHPAAPIHDLQGDYALADGSVQQASAKQLSDQLALARSNYNGDIQNCFMFPNGPRDFKNP